MTQNLNIIVTPLVIQAYKLHKLIFHTLYPYPLTQTVENGNIFVKVDTVLRLRYIPFLVALVVISLIIGLGSCMLIPLFHLFQIIQNIPTLEIFNCTFLGSCAFLEGVIYVVYCKSPETKVHFNQIFVLERTCKQITCIKFRYKKYAGLN